MGEVITIVIPGRRHSKTWATSPLVRARSTRDAFSLASLYDDLANRMAAAWSDLLEGGKGTKDEGAGHEFHGTTSKFEKGMTAVKSLLSSGSLGASGNKKVVESLLREHLEKAPNFVALRALTKLIFSDTGTGSMESKLVQTWAGSSGGANPLSNAMQLAVQEAFDIPEHHVTKQRLHVVKAAGGDHDSVYQKGANAFGGGALKTKEHLGVFKAALKEFAHAQYKATQDMLKSHGVDHVYLARGMKVKGDHLHPKSGAVNLKTKEPSYEYSGENGRAWVTKSGYLMED